MRRKVRGIHEVFAADPTRADWEVWGRRTDPRTRRGFIKGLGAMTALVGSKIVFSDFMPAGLIPAAYANQAEPFTIEGKDGLTVLNDRPLCAETPAHLLNDDVTPASRLFVRNNGLPPEDVDAMSWTLTVDGESAARTKTYTLGELKQRFGNVSRQLIMECGGNGRSEYDPPASGNQWTVGAVGCPRWDGIRLRDVLEDCGYRDDAVYVAYYGADRTADGGVPISRGVTIAKALEAESMIAWGMNSEPLHPMNGHPLRLVFGGWPGSTSGKWLQRIAIRNIVHDGPKMTGMSYKVPREPVAPGTEVAPEDMCIIEAMPVKSLITYPQSGYQHPAGEVLSLHGHAWTGDNRVERLDVSIDFGRTWIRADLQSPVNRLAWQNWDLDLEFPETGYYEVWARAADANGDVQPVVLPGWNPRGYLNNACHRIAVYVA
ncbi:MAG: sulfite oxidase [Holophagales bacterium]|nr:sulfite oxidase [Holophagales bacterium]MYG32336.1 sulfite oxidase [Holophagales bacterium]MYI78495.1 sulfite oxidase [Holophagales bacterium]